MGGVKSLFTGPPKPPEPPKAPEPVQQVEQVVGVSTDEMRRRRARGLSSRSTLLSTRSDALGSTALAQPKKSLLGA